MPEHGWQYVERVAVGAAANVDVTIPPARPVLQDLTVWAISGARTLTNMTFQAKVNGKNYGAAVNIAGAVAADIVYDAGPNGRLFPIGVSGKPPYDDVDVVINVSNAGLATEAVTLYFTGIGRDGGPSR